MSDNSTIEWTDTTWNPTTGCDQVSPGCDHCYALTLAKRLKGMGSAKYQNDGDPRTSGPGFRLTVHEDTLRTPITWRKPRKVFVNSMSDLFHDAVPDLYIAEVFAVMALTPQHTYQILSKRHARMRSLLNKPEFWYRVGRQARHFGYGKPGAANYFADGRNIYDLKGWEQLRHLPNVWLGVSVEDQKRADLRIPALLETPAAVRFLSAEPLLGPLRLDVPPFWCYGHGRPGSECPNDLHLDRQGIDWVIVGGESGPTARPMHPDWARSLRDQCQASGVAFHFKQWGEWGPAPFIVRVCDPAKGWTGTAEELAAAKRASEAAGATHVHTGNSYVEDGETVWSIHEMDHKPWSLERVGLPDGMEPIRRWGKKTAGRDLDGRTWDEFPQAVTR